MTKGNHTIKIGGQYQDAFTKSRRDRARSNLSSTTMDSTAAVLVAAVTRCSEKLIQTAVRPGNSGQSSRRTE